MKEAIFNFIAFLGWSPKGEQEIYSKDALIKAYDPHRMSKSPAFFDQKKLDWINAQYIKKTDADDLVNRIMELIHEQETDIAKKLNSLGYSDDQMKEVILRTVHVHQHDVNKLTEIMEHAYFYATVLDHDMDYSGLKDFDHDDTLKVLEGLKDAVKDQPDDTDPQTYLNLIKQVGKDVDVKGRNLYFPLNITFYGHSSAPQINEIMAIYHPATIVKLLDKAIAAL